MMKTLSSGNCAFSVPAKNSYRMVVLGASRVGKSSIVSRFLNGRFEDQYTPTIEDFHRKVYNIRGDMYQLDILDTSGNHPFPAMRRLSILTGGCLGGVGVRAWAEVLRSLQRAHPSSERKVTAGPVRRAGPLGAAACAANVGAQAQSHSIHLWLHYSWSCLPGRELTHGWGGPSPGTQGLLPASCGR